MSTVPQRTTPPLSDISYNLRAKYKLTPATAISLRWYNCDLPGTLRAPSKVSRRESCDALSAKTTLVARRSVDSRVLRRARPACHDNRIQPDIHSVCTSRPLQVSNLHPSVMAIHVEHQISNSALKWNARPFKLGMALTQNIRDVANDVDVHQVESSRCVERLSTQNHPKDL